MNRPDAHLHVCSLNEAWVSVSAPNPPNLCCSMSSYPCTCSGWHTHYGSWTCGLGQPAYIWHLGQLLQGVPPTAWVLVALWPIWYLNFCAAAYCSCCLTVGACRDWVREGSWVMFAVAMILEAASLLYFFPTHTHTLRRASMPVGCFYCACWVWPVRVPASPTGGQSTRGFAM